LDLGHRRIGIVTANIAGPVGVLADPFGTTSGHVTNQRMHGWLDALDAAGVRPTIVQFTSSGEASGRDAAAVLLTMDARPTGILCFSDATAYGVVQAAHGLGLSVPTDLSVVGFDDNPLALRMHPALTTVRQDVAEKGRAAAAALIAAIQRSKAGSTVRARHVVLPIELVVRASTAPPR
jgi:DNA-binding LacI/PurR family transcriptional regulator